MKKIIVLFFLTLIVFCLCGCSLKQKITIRRGATIYSSIEVDVDDGFVICKDAYSIVDTDKGYDIVVHVEKEEE